MPHQKASEARIIQRTSKPALVNRLARRDFAGIDLTEFLEEPLNVCLVKGESGALFAFRGPGIYEVHVFFAVRGWEALRLGHTMLDVMRSQHGGRFFWSLVPAESRAVLMFTRLMGWKSHGLRETRHGLNELFSSEI